MIDRMADLSAEIESAISSPQSATVDGRSATARSIADLIAADRYLRENAASENTAPGRRLGISFFKTRPPGAVR